ncbi:Ras GTPase activation domain-containing protein [Heterostelium album PN500]|uniref:Ras GTPase activation domain-containing protein n=1 Tax=Heterostelium pallidum (strain ATCC 26659 / Pp 5 / PN500) TaxID=670386 RepID=D3BH41_HETP5|nr:Ras GTPase activation domain-containing protein [Heterostelium album PN500]EFA79425.1 Ras GTPase activation domain-containing protein [Heterostelium album PN500]|eukprot:XP_020431546.1 Ras GTPase activation domain-containing protein [Heterostelium album PN500]
MSYISTNSTNSSDEDHSNNNNNNNNNNNYGSDSLENNFNNSVSLEKSSPPNSPDITKRRSEYYSASMVQQNKQQPANGPQNKPVAQMSIVGKAMGATKTSIKQHFSKQEATQLSPELIINNIKTKALKLLYEETIRLSKKTNKKIERYNKYTEQLKASLTAVGQFYPAEHMTRMSTDNIADIHQELVSLRQKLHTAISNRFVMPAEVFLQQSVIPARDSKDRYRRARIDYDSATNKVRIIQQSNTIDPKQLFSAASQQAILRVRYQTRMFDAHSKLFEAVSRHGFEYLVQSINLLAAEHDYYSAACAKLEEQDKFVQEMRNYAEASRQHYQATKEAEEQRKLEEAMYREDNKYNEMVEIFSWDDLAVVNAICLSSGSDQEAILEDLVRILDAHKQTIPIIKLGITKEVTSTNSAATLFRGNSTATKLMTAFTRMTGRPYLISTLKPIIEKLIKDPTGYELDPEKTSDTTGNCERLTSICQEFLIAIYNSIENCPIPFRAMANHLQNEVVKQFPESKHTSVGGFIFLRFFCPCILSPDANGVTDSSSLTMECRRALILVSKTLQNVANGIQFGTKESYMKEMNPFLERNFDRCKEFLDNIATLPPVIEYTPLSSKSEVKNKELPSIHRLIVKNLEKIFKTLQQYNQQTVTFQLVSSLGRLGDFKEV